MTHTQDDYDKAQNYAASKPTPTPETPEQAAFMPKWKDGAHPRHPGLGRSVLCKQCMLSHPIVVEFIRQREDTAREQCIEAIRAACGPCGGSGSIERGYYACDSDEPRVEQCEYCGRPIAAIRALPEPKP